MNDKQPPKRDISDLSLEELSKIGERLMEADGAYGYGSDESDGFSDEVFRVFDEFDVDTSDAGNQSLDECITRIVRQQTRQIHKIYELSEGLESAKHLIHTLFVYAASGRLTQVARKMFPDWRELVSEMDVEVAEYVAEMKAEGENNA